MSPEQFASLEQHILSLIPIAGIVHFADIMRNFNSNTGYGRSDAKAAFLGLKASGFVHINDAGECRR